jgi:hypothetical protein
MTEDETKYWNGRMAEINDKMERILNRMTVTEGEVKNLGTKTDTAREFSFRVPKLVVDALEAGLFPRLRGIEDVLSTIGARLAAIEAKLEKPGAP